MVSGRDDHGLLERPAIGLQASPTDRAVTATAHDGEFVHVLRRDGLWAYVRLIKGGEEGWIADHGLRGVAADLARGTQVTFEDAAVRDGVPMVRVRPRSGGNPYWIRATDLREVGAR